MRDSAREMERMHQDTPTDGELMVRFTRWRDIEAFEELVRRWERPVLSFLAKACGDWEAARDLRQEVFFRVYRYGGTYKPEHRFTTWLFRIASNCLSTWKTRQSRRRSVEQSAPTPGAELNIADPGAGPREQVARQESRDEIEQAIAGLLPAERELLFLRLNQDLSYREIGEILDAPETTVKSRFYTLLSGLRRTLLQEDTRER